MSERLSISNEKEIEISTILKRLWSWKVRIIITTIIFVIIGIFIAVLSFPITYTTSIQIAMQFDGIANWRNPDGSPFDPSQIIAPSILTKAVKIACPDKKIDDLSKYTSIEPIIPFEIQSKIKVAKKKQEDFQYFPTQFKISITTDKKSYISPREKAEILFRICDTYKKYFEQKFGGAELKEFIVEKDFIDKSEYLDIVKMFRIMTQNLVSFIDSRIAKAGKFRSPKTGLTFSQIKDNILFFSEVQIRNVEALVRKLKLSRDKKRLMTYLEIDIKNKEMEKAKAQYAADTATRLLEMEKFQQVVKSDSSTSTPATATGETKTFTALSLDSSILENLKKNEYVPMLVETILKNQTKAKDCEVDIEYLKKDMEDFTGETNATAEDENSVTQEIEAIYLNIQKLTQKLMELDDEYMKTQINEVIRPINLPENTTNISKFFYILILIAICLPSALSILLSFLLEEIKN